MTNGIAPKDHLLSKIKRTLYPPEIIPDEICRNRVCSIILKAEKLTGRKFETSIANSDFDFDSKVGASSGCFSNVFFARRRISPIAVIIPEAFIDNLSDEELTAFLVSEILFTDFSLGFTTIGLILISITIAGLNLYSSFMALESYRFKIFTGSIFIFILLAIVYYFISQRIFEPDKRTVIKMKESDSLIFCLQKILLTSGGLFKSDEKRERFFRFLEKRLQKLKDIYQYTLKI